MSQLERPSAGQNEVLCLSAGDAQATISLLGGELQSWAVGDRNLLWHGDPRHWESRAPILFPIVGRVRDDQLRLRGKSHPILRHGFAQHSFFEKVAHSKSAAALRLTSSAADTEIPLDFSLDLKVELTPAELRLGFVVKNTGADVLPYALGFHPAFLWPFDGGNLEDYSVWFDQQEVSLSPTITPDGLVGRQLRSVPFDATRLPLEPDLFASGALIFLNAASRWMRYEAPSRRSITMSVENFPHLALWTKPTAPFVSLECWTGHGDPEDYWGDIYSKPSMTLLKPDEVGTHQVRLLWQ